MRPNWKGIIAATLMALVVTPAFAQTHGGRIHFQGAIVTPTCQVPTTWTTRKEPQGNRQGNRCTAATDANQQARAVRIHAESMTEQQTAMLLRTFISNDLATVDGRTPPVMVVYSYR